MTLKITETKLWLGRVKDVPGGAAALLKPLSKAGVNLQFVHTRKAPESPGEGVIFVGPVEGEKAMRAAEAVGLHGSRTYGALRVEGPNGQGLGYAMTHALGVAGINLRGLSAMVMGDKFVSYMVFYGADEAKKAKGILGKLGAKKGKK